MVAAGHVAAFAELLGRLAGAHSGVDDYTAAAPAGDTPGVHAASRLHAAHVRHSLRHGFWQGWDLHPAQLGG